MAKTPALVDQEDEPFTSAEIHRLFLLDGSLWTRNGPVLDADHE